MTRLLTIDVRDEQGVVVARQRTRQVAELLGFDVQDQVRLATAVSEVARNAVQHGGGGRAEFAVERRTLTITLRDQGPGIAERRFRVSSRRQGELGSCRCVPDVAPQDDPY